MRQEFWRGKFSALLAMTLGVIAVLALVGSVQAGGSSGDGDYNEDCDSYTQGGGGYKDKCDDNYGGDGDNDHKTKAPKTKTVVVTPTGGVDATNTPVVEVTATVDVPNGAPDLTPSATLTSVASATSTNTPEGDVGADTATPEATATETPVNDLTAAEDDVDGTGGVLGVETAPEEAAAAQELPDSGVGTSQGSDRDVYGLAGLAFAALAGAGMLLLGRRLYS